MAASAPASGAHFASMLDWVGDRRRGAALLVAIVFVLFGSAIWHRATLDSLHFLGTDQRVRECRIGELLTEGYWNPDPDDLAQRAEGGDLYRPLTLLWMALLDQATSPASGTAIQPLLLNFGNVALHALGVVLRFWLFLQLLTVAGRVVRPHAGAIAFFAALLLAVHPVATEAVATQVGAAEGLAMVAGAAALLAWHRWQQAGSQRHAVWFAVWLLVGLLAKENAVAIAAIAVLGSRLLLRRSWRQCANVGLVAAAPVAVWVLLRLWVTGSAASVHDPVLAGFGAMAALQMALAAIGWYYVPTLVWPFGLLAFVGHVTLWPPQGFTDARVLVGIAALAVGLVGLAMAQRRSPLVAFGLWFFALAFFPVSNLVVPIGALAATRFLYVPMTGLALAAALGIAALLQARGRGAQQTGRVLVVALPLLFAVATVCELPVWSSELTLQRTMAARCGEPMFASGIGTALLPEIDAATARKDTARATELQQEAMRGFDAALHASMPRIPGTDAVPEDVLEVVYQAGMSAALGASQWFGDVPRAIAAAEGMREIARAGARQAAVVRGPTVWPTLESGAECLLSEFAMMVARKARPGSPERREALAQAAECLDRARQLAPDDLRIEEEHLRVVALRGDADETLRAHERAYEIARSLVARQSAATRLALAYSQLLEQRGDADRGLAVALQTLVDGRERFGDSRGYFNYGARAMRSRDPALQALGRQVLGIFLERADARDAANLAAARQMLGRGR